MYTIPPYVPRKAKTMLSPLWLILIICQVIFDSYVVLKVLVPLG
jgi:hypothetical protein